MKKLSERGCTTIVFIIIMIVCTIAVIVINNVQEVQSQKWQEELKVEVEQ